MLGGLLLAGVLALAGCGGEQLATPRPVASAAPRLPASGGAHAVQLANQVCRAVRAGGPAALPKPLTSAALTRYVGAAAPAGRRALVSLQRLQTRYRIPGLARVIDGYVQLTAAYTTVGRAHDPARAGRMIAGREGALSAAARSAKLPACAVGLR
jgi:hypothetical protein